MERKEYPTSEYSWRSRERHYEVVKRDGTVVARYPISDVECIDPVFGFGPFDVDRFVVCLKEKIGVK